MSAILNCGLDQRTLTILAGLIENGVNPEALAAVVKELKRETEALKVKPITDSLPSFHADLCLTIDLGGIWTAMRQEEKSGGALIDSRGRRLRQRERRHSFYKENRLIILILIIVMLKTSFIARASDGLILCETYDSSSSEQGK